MFGSKLRSWMENHIVRPRKKGNKNKNGNSGNLASSTAQNGHKGTPFQGDNTSAIASPARRSEVSPIQCHATSRAGWQSPEDSAISPKSDNYYYHHTVKSLSSPRKMIRNSSCTLESNNSSQQPHPYSKSVDSKQLSKTIDFHKRKDDYSRQSANSFNSTKHLSTTSASSSTSNEMLEAQMPTNKHKSTDLMERTGKAENQFALANNRLRGAEQLAVANMKKLEIDGSIKRDEFHQSSNGQTENCKSSPYSSRRRIEENRYGKIINRNNGEICGGMGRLLDGDGEKIALVHANKYDRFNANVQYQSSRCDNTNTNCANNNAQLHQNNHVVMHVNHQPIHSHSQLNANGNAFNGKIPSGLMSNGNIRGAVNEPNRNLLRTNRYASSTGTHLTASGGGNHQLVHMINSLSSPESAYSTGYSTDGTSPGATYTPEYYINMRTGTHYFPRGVSSAAIEQSRQKFGLNKIDESTIGENVSGNHRRTESCDLNGRNSVPNVMSNGYIGGHLSSSLHATGVPSTGLSPDLQRRLAMQSYKGLESPSPRQRCRIKTNPWFSNVDPAVTGHIAFSSRRIEMDTSSTSSGIKSSSDAGPDDKNGKKILSSESESSSSSTETEVNKHMFSPNTIRKRKVELIPLKDSGIEKNTISINQCESDEDATLNEMMGKFDESYCYERETDILSDSDPTECISDLDTGQDGGDECDTDDILDLDFIDNGSTQEIIDKNIFENKGSCTYFIFQSDKRASRQKKGRKLDESSNSKRKKRLTRTRKRVSESRDLSNENDNLLGNSLERGSKSLGGTPICLRRNQLDDSKGSSDLNPLGNRSNSLTFTEIHSIRSRFLAIAESEKALLKADMEADVKYKQLIHEAETILVSMKTTALRDTPVESPRRICNLPTNKRVEMLRNCEIDLRRELAKMQKSNENGDVPPVPPRKNPPLDICDAPLSSTFQDNLLINKRIESLKFESNSAPNSPKSCRFSPRKTHVTNFINQNATPTDLIRRKSSPEPSKFESEQGGSGKLSPQLQLNGRKVISPPKSPTPRRRFRSQSPKVIIDSDSDSENGQKSIKKIQKRGLTELNGNKENYGQRNNRKTKLKNEFKTKICQDDIFNQNIPPTSHVSYRDVGKKPLMAFRSIDMGNKDSEIFYCPQSEPLKRKIYSGSSTLEKLKKSLEMDSEIPKKALLEKISQLRRERGLKFQIDRVDINGVCDQTIENTTSENTANLSKKHQLILNTIEDLKRSLEDQSVELCGLNDDDD